MSTAPGSPPPDSLFGTGPRGIFRRTLPTAEHEPEHRMVRAIGLGRLTLIGIGAIIGAGIFTLAGSVAHDTAGPAVLVSFLVAGLASVCAAFCYAEFAGFVPRAGSSYTYGASVLGEIVGWIIGWDLLLEYTAIVAVVSIGMSGYVDYLLHSAHINLPLWMQGAPGTGTGHYVDLIAMVICVGVAWLLNQGTKRSTRVDAILTIVKIAVVLLVVIVGLFKVHGSNLTPFAPFGWGGAMTGAATVFFAVFGYDALSTAAEESIEAKRHLPKAMIISLAVSMLLYVLACIVLTGMVNYKDINPTSGFSSAFQSVGLGGIGDIIAIGAVLGIVTVCFSFMMGASRMWYAMSRDGLMPAWFGRLHPRRRVPTRATWVLGGASAVLAGLLPVNDAAELVNIGVLLAFVVVCAAVVVLRYRRPDLPRGFKVPWMPVVPIVGIGFSIWLTTFLTSVTWWRFVIWLVVGLIVYSAYGYRKTRQVMPGGSVSLDDLQRLGQAEEEAEPPAPAAT
ncbi:MAG TPA: amino acid permease [Streptosporangiaceae bacterium]